jgi:hypothetical protein
MRIAYLILAHNTPHHTERLIKALSRDHQEFIVHVDAKVDLAAFFNLRQLPGSAVRFTGQRVPVYWGEFSQVGAILVLIADCRSAVHSFATRLSDLAEWERLPIGEPCVHCPLPAAVGGYSIHQSCPDAFDRARQTHLAPREILPKVRPAWRAFAQAPRDACPSVIEIPTKLCGGVGSASAYAGSTWWALTADAARHVLEFSRKNDREMSFFANTAHPDEHVIHMIIGNSSFADRVQHGPTYADWSQGASSPATLSETHIRRLMQQAHPIADDGYGRGALLFARKFPDASESLKHMIDNWIAHK